MKLIPFYGRSWESNSYLITDGGLAILIDAGVAAKEVLLHLERENAKLQYILLTHGHFDHTVSVDLLREQTDARLAVHQADAEMLTDAQKSARVVFFGTYEVNKEADLLLTDTDTLAFGDQTIRLIHTPGHSAGSVCYQIENMLFTGDTLFDGSYGRFDLYGGDARALVQSLEKLKAQDPSLTIYPGHGGSALLGEALTKLFGHL